MNKNIKVSIILPTYNGEKYISRAIESVLSQTFTDWELIIINDKSTDRVENIINGYLSKDLPIIYIKNDINLGIGKSFNRGLEESKGDYIARIDDDDIWVDKDKLKKQIKFLDNNPEYVLVGTGVINIDRDGKEINRYLFPQTDREIREKLLRINFFVSSSVLFRSKILKMTGYSNSLLEDYDLCLSLGIYGKVANLNDYSVKYYLKSKQGTNNKNKILRLKENLNLIEKYKKYYPHYIKAIVLGYIKLIFYPIFKILPLTLKGAIMKIHKKL